MDSFLTGVLCNLKKTLLYYVMFFLRLVSKLGLHSRLWLLAACTIAAAPLAAGVLYFDPPGAMGFLIGYYLFAETWFAVLFTVIVEIVEPEVSHKLM